MPTHQAPKIGMGADRLTGKAENSHPSSRSAQQQQQHAVSPSQVSTTSPSKSKLKKVLQFIVIATTINFTLSVCGLHSYVASDPNTQYYVGRGLSGVNALLGPRAAWQLRLLFGGSSGGSSSSSSSSSGIATNNRGFGASFVDGLLSTVEEVLGGGDDEGLIAVNGLGGAAAHGFAATAADEDAQQSVGGDEDGLGDASTLEELAVMRGVEEIPSQQSPLTTASTAKNPAESTPSKVDQRPTRHPTCLPPAKPLTPPPSVVTIVGGGLAGLLTTLETLTHSPPNTIVVLVEGGNAFGGRVANRVLGSDTDDSASNNSSNDASQQEDRSSPPTPSSQMVEIGATFIHGIEDNPITKLANHYKLKTRPVNYDSVKVIDSVSGRTFRTAFVDAVKESVYNVARSIFFYMRDERAALGLADVALDVIYREAVHIALHGLRNETSTPSSSTSSSSPASPSTLFSGTRGKRALYKVLKKSSLGSSLDGLVGMRHFDGEDDDVELHTDTNKNSASHHQGRRLANVEQVLSWHFYWEIVQDQIAPLNDLGSYAYDNSLGFRGPDHVFDGERGIQSLMDSLVGDIMLRGGLLNQLQQRHERQLEEVGQHIHSQLTDCAAIPSRIVSLIAAAATSQASSSSANNTTTITTPNYPRLILSLNCSISHVTDNQLPSVQEERRAEMQSVLDNKRLAHRKGLLGGDGSAGSGGAPTPNAEGVTKAGADFSETRENIDNQPSVDVTSAPLPLAAFAVTSVLDAVDAIAWGTISNVVLPIVRLVIHTVVGCLRVVAVLARELWAMFIMMSQQTAHISITATNQPLQKQQPLWNRIVAAFNNNPLDGGSFYFDAEVVLATTTTSTITGGAADGVSSPLPSLLPHPMKIAAKDKLTLRDRFVATRGEDDPIADRSEVMADKRRLSSDKVYFNTLAGAAAGGSNDDGDDEEIPNDHSSTSQRVVKRRGGRKAARNPEDVHQQILNDDEQDTNTKAFIYIINTHVRPYLRKAHLYLKRRLSLVARRLRLQYRKQIKRPTSFLNKALFFIRHPMAVVPIMIGESRVVSALQATGAVVMPSASGASNGTPSAANNNVFAASQQASRGASGIRLAATGALLGGGDAPKTPLHWWDTDVVVVTAPLGVLQRSVGTASASAAADSGPTASTSTTSTTTTSSGVGGRGTIRFTPQLPLRKREAIAATGCSETLKIALQFEDIFWPEEVEFFGIAVPSRVSNSSSAVPTTVATDSGSGNGMRTASNAPQAATDPLLLPATHFNNDFAVTHSPQSYLFGDAEHIEIVNLHKLRRRTATNPTVSSHSPTNNSSSVEGNGVLILEVENALARRWSSYANHTLLIETEVMPRLRDAFARNRSSSARVPLMPKWYAVNNYLKNPHIRCGFSYWRVGRDGRDNLLLRAGLWPDGHQSPLNRHTAAATASVLFSPLTLSLSHHRVNLRSQLGGASSSTATSPASATAGSTNSLTSPQTSVATPASISISGRNRLLFAGEHTSPDLYGNMHGAVVEGQRAAAEVVAVLQQQQMAFDARYLEFWRQTTIGRLLSLLWDLLMGLDQLIASLLGGGHTDSGATAATNGFMKSAAEVLL